MLEVALLRDLSSLSWQEIARRTGASATAGKRRYEVHRREIGGLGAYPRRLQDLAAQLLARLG